MSATTSRGARSAILAAGRVRNLHVFEAALATLTVAALAYAGISGRLGGLADTSFVLAVLFWTGLIAVVEFLQVVAWRTLRVSIGFPLYMAVAFHFAPWVAALIGFLGSSDPRELRGEIRVLHSLSNRSQIALSQLVASATFHVLGGSLDSWQHLWPGPIAVLAAYLINSALVSIGVTLESGVPIGDVFRRLRIGNPVEFFISYIGLGVLGLILAALYRDDGEWVVAVFTLPLLLVRQMFFRTRALEEATKELQDREVVLRALSNRMAEERQDERMQIAGYLHDDLAQVLYRMALHLDVVDANLRDGDPESAGHEIERLRTTRNRAQELIRSLIRDLHRSPLGRAGLAQALESFCQDVQEDTRVRIRRRLEEIDMPPALQLLCYHVAREAVMNAVKHAEPSAITVSLAPLQDGARLTVADDGRGFDPDEAPPEGHYGLTMMRERAQVAGGSFTIDSAPGRGTVVTAEFPTSWLSDPALGAEVADEGGQA